MLKLLFVPFKEHEYAEITPCIKKQMQWKIQPVTQILPITVATSSKVHLEWLIKRNSTTHRHR